VGVSLGVAVGVSLGVAVGVSLGVAVGSSVAITITVSITMIGGSITITGGAVITTGGAVMTIWAGGGCAGGLVGRGCVELAAGGNVQTAVRGAAVLVMVLVTSRVSRSDKLITDGRVRVKSGV
jgi:hypothetical protein